MADPRTLGESPEARPSKLLRDRDLWRLLDYWCSKRHGRPMPARTDIDPTEIAWALSRILLADYSPQDGFRYRLAGEEVAAAFGRRSMKGLAFTDFLPPERARFVEQRWLPLVRDRCVVVMSGMVYLAAERTPIGERLLLPLADSAEGPVTGVLGMTVCEWVAGNVPREVQRAQVEYIPVDQIP